MLVEPLGLGLVDQPHRALGQPCCARKASSASAMTSTMALPIASTSRRGCGHEWVRPCWESAAPSGGSRTASRKLGKRQSTGLLRCAAMRQRHAPLSRLRSSVVAACATTPAAQADDPASHAGRPPERGDLIGLTATELIQRFGNPTLQVREGSGLKLQFRAQTCVLDAYLYPRRLARAGASPTSTPGPLGRRHRSGGLRRRAIGRLKLAPSPIGGFGDHRVSIAEMPLDLAPAAPGRRCCRRRSGNCGSSGCGRCA